MKQPTWFNRWRRFPMSIIGHIATGAASGALAAYGHDTAALVWLACYIGYQAMSWARKHASGRGDSAGLDIYDFAVGFIPTYIAVAIVLEA